MAKGWHRDKNGRVWFYVHRDGKQYKVPRAQTRHLDSEPDHNVETERRLYALKHETTPQWETLTDQDTLALVDAFCAYLQTRKKSPKTIRHHRYNLTHYCLPFLVQKEGLNEPHLWPRKSVRLLEHLEMAAVGAHTINKCNVSLRVFWTWLLEEGRVTGPLLLRNVVMGQQQTPLSFTVTPENILGHVYKSEACRLLALLGYFFSLRPQELVALRPCDFLAGSRAAELEPCKVMKQYGLYDRLAVHVHRQRVSHNFAPPKSNSAGWVACFSHPGAVEIVKVLRDLAPEELIFPKRIEHWYRAWAKPSKETEQSRDDYGYPGLTLKDLRRASLYWLGNHTSISFTALKNHARHADPSTTALYVRRPGEEALAQGGPLNLDD